MTVTSNSIILTTMCEQNKVKYVNFKSCIIEVCLNALDLFCKLLIFLLVRNALNNDWKCLSFRYNLKKYIKLKYVDFCLFLIFIFIPVGFFCVSFQICFYWNFYYLVNLLSLLSLKYLNLTRPFIFYFSIEICASCKPRKWTRCKTYQKCCLVEKKGGPCSEKEFHIAKSYLPTFENLHGRFLSTRGPNTSYVWISINVLICHFDFSECLFWGTQYISWRISRVKSAYLMGKNHQWMEKVGRSAKFVQD